MAFTKTLPTDVLNSIAAQLGARIQPVEGNRHFFGLDGQAIPDEGLNVGESFELWKFIPDALEEIADGNRDISTLVRRSGVWHHQLRRNEEAVGFARSKPLGSDAASWSLRDIFISELGQRIDGAIAYIDDQQMPDDVEVRLISMPIQQLEAFWFVAESDRPYQTWANQVLIVSAPERIPEFTFLRQMGSEDFLAALVTKERGMGIRSTL